MTEFDNIVIGSSAIPSLIITVILMLVIPVIFFIYWRKKHKQQTKLNYLIAGTVGFIVSARVLELGVHYFCILADNPVSRYISRPLSSNSAEKCIPPVAAYFTARLSASLAQEIT